jgi:hypothetical protein
MSHKKYEWGSENLLENHPAPWGSIFLEFFSGKTRSNKNFLKWRENWSKNTGVEKFPLVSIGAWAEIQLTLRSQFVKKPEKLLFNPSSGIEHIFTFKPDFSTFSTLVSKR